MIMSVLLLMLLLGSALLLKALFGCPRRCLPSRQSIRQS